MARQTRPSLGATLTALPTGLAIVLLAALPSFFNLATAQIFEEQKSLLLRAAALMAVPGLVALWSAGGTRRLWTQPIVLLWFALIAALALSTVLGGSHRDALFGAYLRRHGLVTWLALGALFAGMLEAARLSSGRDLIVRAAAIGGCWPAAYLLLQHAGFDAIHWIAPSENFQSGSTFGNHVLIGGYLAMVIPLTALAAWRSHPAWLGPLAIQIAALVVSGSRGAAIALAGAIATSVMVVYWRRVTRTVAIGMAAAAVVMLVAAVAVPALRPAAIIQRLNPQAGSARVRILIWQDTIDLLRQSGASLFVGHGPESLRSLFPKHYSPEIGHLEQTDAMPDRAHNETLDMLVSGGVIGALLQWALFAAVLVGAFRIGDVRVSACLAAAVVAHVIEIQFGIASVSSRLGFLAIAALVLGGLVTDRDPVASYGATGWLMAAAAAGVLSPWLSNLPSTLNNPLASGTQEQFIDYLRRMSAATPFLYAGLLVIAIGVSYSIAVGKRATTSAWWQIPLLVVGAWLVVPVSIEPSRADGFADAGASYERDQRWPESAVAYEAAAAAAPEVAEYHTALARTSIQWAVRSEPPRRDQLLQQARTAYERAMALEPAVPEHARQLGAYFRVLASTRLGTARDEALKEADRIYAAASVAAPTVTPVWVEWAWVDVDRGQPSDALRKLERALALDPLRADAQRLRAELLAKPGQSEAK